MMQCANNRDDERDYYFKVSGEFELLGAWVIRLAYE